MTKNNPDNNAGKRRVASLVSGAVVGQVERVTQNRVVTFFRERLHYDYLGNWQDRVGNRNIEEAPLRAFLQKSGYSETLITRVLHELGKVAGNATLSPYDANKAVYDLLRYGVKVREEVGQNTQTVWLVDWKQPQRNHFAIAEEVSVSGPNSKRPDIVVYLNGIALGVLELKRSTVSVAEGIRQNLDNQKSVFIQPFFTTMQLVLAGNETEGLRYGTIQTKEKYYLDWKEEEPESEADPGRGVELLLDRQLARLCSKERLLEIIHDFVVFDSGVKKLCRPNQYFGVRSAQAAVKKHEGGIIWHTQGSGKSLTMVWLTKWLRENRPSARVLIITDRIELDEQIEKVFKGVNEDILRTRNGAELIQALNATTPWLLCSLIHKFGSGPTKKGAGSTWRNSDEGGDVEAYIRELKSSLPPGFATKGDLYVYVDECHRTQSGKLHEAMKELVPGAMFIGFTGTPLLKADKQKSIEIFGPYIHIYKFDQAVRDGVVLDLRYEARDIDQNISSPSRIDAWFEAKTKGLNDFALAQLKHKWGTMQKVLSSQSRLEKIVADILLDIV